MMKKLLIPVLIFLASAVHGQLNNSWIDYNKTYYKFRLAKDTLTHIPQSVLASAGLGSIPADQFQLWRNGQQVRIYTSVASGPLGAADYIEFWALMNDGKPDKQLYKDPLFQLADKYSLETDTVAYFLTVNTAGGNLRYTNAVNNAPGTMIPDAYFMRNIDMSFRTRMNRGLAYVVGEYLWSSSYDEGEGWASGDIAPCCALTQEFFNLNVYTAGPSNGLSVRVNASGNAPNTRDLSISVYGANVFTQGMPFFETKRVNLTGLSTSLLLSPNQVPISISTVSPTSSDRIAVASIGITYPATFNFNNQKSFAFDIAPSPSGNYLLIDNFNYGSTAPVLFDLTNGLRYIGDILTTPGKVKIVLPSSAVLRKFLLVSLENANISNVTSLTPRNFIKFSNTSAQGDYMIISNPLLYNDGNGVNYVEQYRQYRNSVSGGSFTAKVYDMDELVDQFAFGIKKHPSSIRDFVRYADQQFTVKPKYVFLIGRGINYIDHRDNESNPLTGKMDLVPTFGWPASDMLLTTQPGSFVPLVPIGRLSAVTGLEVSNYLDKIKQYEQAQQTPGSTINSKAWMKNMIHVAGGKDSSENAIFLQYMEGYKNIAKDTLYGAYVETFSKTSTGAVQEANSQRIHDLFEQGLGFIGYFGHSSANTFEFNLSDPTIYNNPGKYPFFNVSGCSAGNFYIFDPLRLSGNLTLSEKYVLTPQRGSIGFLADTHFGVPPFLNYYNTAFYTKFARTMYGNSVGNQVKSVVQELASFPNFDFLTRIHIEEITLHGDPAVKINSFPKPDYVIEDQLIRISPNIITVADNNFNVKIKMQNIGKATNDSIWVSVKRKLPNDTIRVLYNQLIPAIKYADSINLDVVINPTTDKGLNQLIVTLDYTNRVDELFETNNTVTKDFYIFEDELRPSYPYNFSIVNQQNITFIANTANPLSGMRQYTMEIDTTELFNSPFKKTYNTSGPGGVVQFLPSNLNFVDSTVYYWRVAMVPIGAAQVIYNGFSFTYLANSSPGYSQKHYYQFKKSVYSNITLEPNRNFIFNRVPRNITIRTGLYPYYDYDRINVNLDFDQLELYGCNYNSIQVYVFDSTTLKPWRNTPVSATNGLYGSNRVCANSAIAPDPSRAFFEFKYNSPVTRQAAMNFIENVIPAGMYVAITNLGITSNTSFIADWQADQATLGTGRSLYHTLKAVGFTQIDSFTRNLPFLYFYQKGMPGYAPTQRIGPGDSSQIEQAITLNTTYTSGTIESPVFGPVRSWQSLHWKGYTVDPAPLKDTAKIQVYGIKYNGSSDLLATVSPATDTTLSFINAATYPFLKLKMLNKDLTYATPYQLRYLIVNAAMAPEGAVSPNLLYKMKDTVEQGEFIDFALAFKNISQTKFDTTIKIKFIITDRDNVPHVVDLPRGKALVAGDSLSVHYSIDTRNYPGTNTLFIDFNPDNDQAEQYHYNNVLYKDFYVKADKFNPLLDITFDGVHILNKDIVSSRPAILVKLKDESRFLALKDTSLINVMVRYPDQTLHTYYFGDTMRFNPANLANGENTASIDFNPYFAEDGEYELIVTGKDAAGNKAGELEYRVVFNVINKPMISNLLNYPNPFTTSTAFVFTITGSEIPQNMRIQVLTITGKIVREITKQELGPIQIGRNITEFKWDGTDMYGQKLANGVYLYRVLTNLNGKKLDKYEGRNSNGNTVTEGLNGTDKYFNKGYGKMYLMR